MENKARMSLSTIREQKSATGMEIADKLYDNLLNASDDPSVKARLLATATKESRARLAIYTTCPPPWDYA